MGPELEQATEITRVIDQVDDQYILFLLKKFESHKINLINASTGTQEVDDPPTTLNLNGKEFTLRQRERQQGEQKLSYLVIDPLTGQTLPEDMEITPLPDEETKELLEATLPHEQRKFFEGQSPTSGVQKMRDRYV